MDGPTLERRRKALGMTQTELASVLSVPQATISRWENGRHAIEHGAMLDLALQAIAWRPVMECLAKALDVAPAELLKDGRDEG